MSLTTQMKNQHLLWRAGFGVTTPANNDSANSPQTLYKELARQAGKVPVAFDVASASLKDIHEMDTMTKLKQFSKDGLDANAKRKLRQQSREDIKKLNLAWMNEMVATDNPLREKMALFWHGHFACRDINIFHQQQLLQQIRTHAVGNFGDLLKAISMSPSMLAFLNNQQNKKQHPNENFAREVMELFTLGRGNYTEKDVKEAARAFTGWGFDIGGEFRFRKNQHDDGQKTVLGKSGNFDGTDVLNILLQQKQTAKFITQKIYKYFVNEKVNADHVNVLADNFYRSNYDIAALMKDIFTSDWFYSSENIGVRIKSPIELLVGIRRLLPMQLESPDIQLLFQRALGQILFYPPNVAGWPGDKNWIDSSTLMLRMRIPMLIKDDDTFQLTAKTDDDQQMGMMEQQPVVKGVGKGALAKAAFRVRANVDWETYCKRYEKVQRQELYTAIMNTVLQPGLSIDESATIAMVDSSTRENYIKTLTVALMSTPEYQLC